MIVAEAMANNVDITPASAEAAANVPLPATRGRKWGSNAAASSTKKKSRRTLVEVWGRQRQHALCVLT